MPTRKGCSGSDAHATPLPSRPKAAEGEAASVTVIPAAERPEPGNEPIGRRRRRRHDDLFGEASGRDPPRVAGGLELTDETLERLRRDVDAVDREVELVRVDAVHVDADRDRWCRER